LEICRFGKVLYIICNKNYSHDYKGNAFSSIPILIRSIPALSLALE